MFSAMSATKTEMPANAVAFISYFSMKSADLGGDTEEEGEETEEEGDERRLWDNSHLDGTAFGSDNFIENTFYIWVVFVIVIAFFPIALVMRICTKTAGKRILSQYNLNAFMRFFLVFYLPLMIACLVNIKNGQSGSAAGFYFGLLVALFMVIFTINVIVLTTKM